MANNTPHPLYPTFSSLYTHLLTLSPPLLPPQKTLSADLTSAISSLSLHPTLEVACHILNHDLPSAHFLVRHMQSPPAYEGMFLHGILHRVEGDYDNARAWYGDVADSDVFKQVWGKGEGKEGGREKAMRFIDDVEKLRKKGEGGQGELGKRSREEVERVVEFCKGKFGEGRWGDVRGEWVGMGEKHKDVAEKMLVGGEGWRQF
ncbi:MAG: hypothetical protein Q9220_003179 [cf. Caloplaca sp. 1 TL-2023]